MMERTLTSPNAAASSHVSREMRSTFISCIFNIRLYKRCRTEPGVYESIEQRVMAAEGRLRARLSFLLLNVNEVRRKERSFSRALGPIVPWINHETSLTVASLSYGGGAKRNLSRRIPSSPMTLLIWEECAASFCSVRLFNNFPNLTSGEINTKWVSL